MDGTSNTAIVGSGPVAADLLRHASDTSVTVDHGVNGGGWGDFLNGEHWLRGSQFTPVGSGTQGPCPINCTNFRGRGYHSFHPGGVHFLLCDGSTRFVTATVEPYVLAALITRRGGEVTSLP